jgi:hypothetical protein
MSARALMHFPVPRWTWLVPVGIAIAFAAIVFLAPAEKTLGETIRFVYVHVALTRAGMYGFYIAGLLGILVAVSGRARLGEWTGLIAWVAFGLFLAGGLASLFAQQRSWGGMLLAEPRNQTTLSVLAVGVIVLIVAGWIPWLRVRGLLYVGLAGYVAWIIPRTPLVLHPANAAGSSTSPAIRLAFPLLTGLAFLFGAWLVWYLGVRRTAVVA